MNTWIKAVGTLVLMAAWSVGCALPVPGQGTWETTLQPRDLNGDSVTDAYFDTDLNITWLANANANGPMTWARANTWANNLTVGSYSDWRLPIPTPGGSGAIVCTSGGTNCGFNVDPSSSEMAHLFHVTLGNISAWDTTATFRGGTSGIEWGLVNTGPFTDFQSYFYWFGTPVATDPGITWNFSTNTGNQGAFGRGNPVYAMAARDGDVTASIPEPQT